MTNTSEIGWVFFKFAAPVALSAATAYAVDAFTSASAQVTLFRDATIANWARMLRTTTTQAPAAGDDFVVLGEHTGAGTGNDIVVTMDETAATDYGSTPTAANSLIQWCGVCQRGTLKWNDASAANPKLRLSNALIVHRDGILNIGTTGTPIPRDSVATLEFDCAADGDYGLIGRDGSTVIMQGLSRTSGKNIVACKATADVSASGGAPSTSTISVDTDTGWLSGDMVAIASTTRTVADCEVGTLNANAGASSIVVNNMTAGAAGNPVPPTSNRGCLVAHSGTSPTQAEIINITRNVRVRSTSATIMAYVNFKPLCSVDLDWAEFYWLGQIGASKRGVEIEASSSGQSTAKSIQFCSLHDCETCGFYCGTGSNSLNTVFASNVGWLCASVTGPAWTIQVAITLADWTFDNNILIRTLNSNGWTLTDMGGVFTNNTVAGATSAGVSFAEISGQVGTASGNIAHSNGANGFIGASNMSGTIGSTVAWRNNAPGFSPAAAVDLILDGVVLFGNLTDNMLVNVGSDIILKNPVFNGDTTFSTANGIRQASVGLARVLIDGGDFSTVAGIKTAHTNDISIGSGGADMQVTLRNTKLGAGTEVSGQSQFGSNGYVASAKHDQIAGNHRTWLVNGTLQTDTAIFKTASPSLRMTPIVTQNTFTGTTTNTSTAVTGITALTVGWVPRVGDRATGTGIADGTTLTAVDLFAGTATLSIAASATGSRTFTLARKLESAPQFQGTKVAVASGASVSISVWARKSVVGDGTAYNGGQPRLVLKANPAIGIAADVVLATASGAAGSWEQMTGTTATATDDGVMEFAVDADGSTGWVNADDWTVP